MTKKSKLIPIREGIKYALWFVLIGAIMGAIYGAFAGMILVPALFSIVIIGIMVTLNFFVALLVFIPNLLFALFKKSSSGIYRYFGLSFGFFIVFTTYFALLKIFSIEVF